MSASKLLLVCISLTVIGACSSNKKLNSSSPAAEPEAVSDEMVMGSVMAEIFIIRRIEDAAEVSLEAEVVKVIKNGPQSPVLNTGDRLVMQVLKNELQDKLPEAGDQITALIISRQVVNLGDNTETIWELSELY